MQRVRATWGPRKLRLPSAGAGPTPFQARENLQPNVACTVQALARPIAHGLLCRVRLVVPRATTSLAHAAYLMRPTAAGVALAAPAQFISLHDAALIRRGALTATGAIEDVAWAPGGRVAAVIDEEGLRTMEVARDAARWRVVGKSYACHFTADGEALWVVRPAAHGPGPGDGPGAYVELRDSGNGVVQRRRYLPDPFGGAAFTLAPHPATRSIVVWIAAPDGASRSFVVSANAEGLTVEQVPIDGGYPPEPIGGTAQYLLARGEALERRSWSGHAVLDEMIWPWLEDAPLAVLALDERLALWASQAGRLHLIDHREMSYLDEISIVGRPPRPISEYLPDSAESYWGTDFQQLCAVAGHVILQFGERDLVSLELAALTEGL